MTTDRTTLMLGLGAAIVGGVVLYRLSRAGAQLASAGAGAVAGIVTGSNPVTQNATNAAGVPTTAYVGAGLAGTVGATVNAASGGVLASLGESIGGWFYDLTHSPDDEPDQRALPASGASQGNSAAQVSGWDYSGKGQTFEQLSQPGGWWPYDVSLPMGQVVGA